VERLRELAFDTPCLGVVPFLPYVAMAEEDAVSFADDASHTASCEVLPTHWKPLSVGRSSSASCSPADEQ